DGYVAGPGQCEEQPLGVGGRELHDWHLGPTKNHPVNRQVVSDMMDGMGATSRPTTAQCLSSLITHTTRSRWRVGPRFTSSPKGSSRPTPRLSRLPAT